MTNGWQTASIGEVAKPIERAEAPMAGITYRQIGVRLWGQGAYERESIDGSQTKYATLSRVESGDIVVNKIWARNGSVAVVSDKLSGCFGSSEFPTFAPNREKLEPKWFHWMTKTKWFWQACDEKSQGTSGKNRIRPEKFLEIEIPLPPLDEQRRIVGRVEALAARIATISRLRGEQQKDIRYLLLSSFNKITENVPRLLMRDVAPLVRRPVAIDASVDYPELGIRSFGKGTFHKPAINGAMLGTKRLFRIELGDLVFNNVFAWEGAVAVAKKEDKGRAGSHRFITCVPKDKIATSDFLCFYFLTQEGLEKLGTASPGGAGRNRTLGLEALGNILVPVPDYEKQVWFDSVQARLASLRQLQSETEEGLSALLPSVLDRAFKGEL